MSRLLPAVVVFAAVTGLVVVSDTSVAPAQVKDKDKKDDKAKAAAKEEGTIEVYMAKDGYRFRVRNAEGKIIAIPVDGHEKKEDCLKQIESVKAVLNKGKIVELKADKK